MLVIVLLSVIGSSPLSRGIRSVGDGPLRRRGIIPALAGNTPKSPTPPSARPDHPRSRGEYQLGRGSDESGPGSSPLSRGIRTRRRADRRHNGIIPALAGNTCHQRENPYQCTDHPRSRGEYVPGALPSILAAGSSPLSRGIPPADPQSSPRNRIIPALAGNTLRNLYRGPYRRDHPRSRGEYGLFASLNFAAEGSSPLSRGIPNLRREVHVAHRIIPALAGNTAAKPSTASSSSDHPRSRGEYFCLIGRGGPGPGSSPLSRGIRSM